MYPTPPLPSLWVTILRDAGTERHIVLERATFEGPCS